MNPRIKAIIDYFFEKLEAMVTSIIISSIIGGCVYWKEHSDTKWIGQHLQQKQQEIRSIQTNEEDTISN